MGRVCRVCKTILILYYNWTPGFANNGHYICKKCESIRKQKYKKPKIVKSKKTLVQSNLDNRVKNYSIKERIVKEYGGKCECCNIDIWQFLTIDHINNDGAEHRLIINKTGIPFYKWLKKEGFPKSNYRLLCNNCNSSYGHNGFCHHSLNSNKLQCSDCETILDVNNANLYQILDNINLCDDCVIKKSIKKINYKFDNNKKKHSKSYAISTKIKVINGYGGECECCKENNYLLLTIDHIDGGGTKIREGTKIFGAVFYRQLIKDNFPTEYRLLCYNCNCCRGAYGKCYHELCSSLNKNSVSISEYKDIILNDRK